MGMSSGSSTRRVVILAPMPLELKAITSAFGLGRASDAEGAPWTGRVGNSEVTALHIGMGRPSTRSALSRLFDKTAPDYEPVDHVMIAGICGGIDPDLPVGTLVNPKAIVEYARGVSFRHTPPGDAPQAGKLITTDGVMLDMELTRHFLEMGCLGVDMESSAVAEVCEANGCPWSVYRCISDRIYDGLLDDRILALSNGDGSANMAELERLLAAEPEVAQNLERLNHDATLAARRAAEAAFRGCVALDT